MGFLGLHGKEQESPNFRDRTKWMVPLDLARLRVEENIPKPHLPSKINITKILEHRINLKKKWNFMNFFFLNLNE